MSVVDFSKLSLLLVPGIALWLTTRLAIGVGRDESKRGGPFSLLRWTSILLMLFGCLGVAAAFLNPIGILISPLLLIVFFSFLVFRRRLECETFLNCVLLAYSQGLDMEMVAEAFEKEASWLNRGRIRRFRIAQKLRKNFVESFSQTGFGLPVSLQLQVAVSTLQSCPLRKSDEFERPLHEISVTEDRYRAAVREFVETLIYIGWMPILLVLVQRRLVGLFDVVEDEFQLHDSSNSIVPVSEDFWFEIDWLLYTGPCIAGISAVVFLVAVLAYSELLPKSLWILRRVHRLYDQAIVQWSLGFAGKQGCDLRKALTKITESHPYWRWRREASKILENPEFNDVELLNRFGSMQLLNASEMGRMGVALRRGDWGDLAMRRSRGIREASIQRWLYAARTLGPLLLILLGLWLGAIAVWMFLKLNDFSVSSGMI